MANSIVLVLAPLTADQVAAVAPAFAPDTAAGLGPWPDDVLAEEVQAAFWHALVDWSFVADLTADLDPDAPGTEIMVTRKLAPMAVLLPALGWDRARTLPGAAGTWLLDPAAVRASAAAVEQAFTFAPPDRESVLARMAQALTLGDQPDLGRLLDAVPAAFTAARRQGMGMICCTAVVG